MQPWTDIRNVDFNDNNYRAPALHPVADEYETHGGEDVPILANGPFAHLFTGVHEQSYIAHAIEYAAGWSELPMISSSTNQSLNLNGFVLILVLGLSTQYFCE